MQILIDALGWIGVVNTFYRRAHPSMGLKVAWIGIAVLVLRVLP